MQVAEEDGEESDADQQDHVAHCLLVVRHWTHVSKANCSKCGQGKVEGLCHDLIICELGGPEHVFVLL